MREKPVMNVDDVFLILHHHWVMDTATFPDGRQRLQVPFLRIHRNSARRISVRAKE
jgi:hypothetical protein